MACLTKIIPPIFIPIHYVIMIIILALWGLILGGTCSYSIPNCATYYDTTKYYNTSNVLNLAITIIWFFLHYIGAIIRDIVYQEPFMYSPTIGKPTFFGIMLKKVGP